jgi:hypothetical protein
MRQTTMEAREQRREQAPELRSLGKITAINSQ